MPQDVVVVRVSDADMESMQSMACSDDPVVRAAIDSICRATDAGAITLDSKNTVAPSVFDELVHQHWRAAAMQVLSHKYRFGFMPYIRVNVERDCGKDEWWVKKNAEWVKKNPGKTVRAFSVPVIPAFGTYEVYVYNDELMQTRVLCLPRDTGDTKAYPIQTIVFDEIYLPRITVVHPRVARLQSTVATLGRSYLSTCLAREIHMNAAVARANPVVFLQHDMKSIGCLLYTSDAADE